MYIQGVGNIFRVLTVSAGSIFDLSGETMLKELPRRRRFRAYTVGDAFAEVGGCLQEAIDEQKEQAQKPSRTTEQTEQTEEADLDGA